MPSTKRNKKPSYPKIDIDRLAYLRHGIFSYFKDNLHNQIPLVPLHSMRDMVSRECTCKDGSNCNSLAKHPKVSSYQEDIKKNIAYDYERKVFYSDYELANIGAVCGYSLESTHGKDKVLFVIDIDHKDPWNVPFIKDFFGEEDLKTFGYRTGSGGMHLWYAVDKNHNIHSNTVKSLFPFVDTRGSNGYVIVPGSIHETGNLYDFDKARGQGFHMPVLELPQSVLEAIIRAKAAKDQCSGFKDLHNVSGGKKAKSKKKDKVPAPTLPTNSIKQLKKIIEKDLSFKIPVGARNNTIYRLLAHERALGGNRIALLEKAKYYRTRSEDGQSLRMSEINRIISSAMKNKPAIKKINNHTDLAKNYFLWKERRHNVQLSVKEKKKIVQCDDDFFKRLTTSDENGTEKYMSIDEIHTKRDAYIKEHHGIHGFFRYPQKYLAQKLRELGFQRKRTAKGNLWNVYVPVWEKILDLPKKKNKEVYSNSLMSYPVSNSVSTQTSIISSIGFIAMSSTTTTAPQQEDQSQEEEQENTGPKMPDWASKEHRPDIIYGENVDDPNAFVPPGFQDEIVIKYGDYTRHPEESKYFRFGLAAAGTFELNEKFQNFIETVTQEEADAFSEQRFIRDVDGTALDFDSIKEGDVIGLMLLEEPTTAYALEVLKTLTAKDMLVCRQWNGEVKSKRWSKYKGIIAEDPEVDIGLTYVTFEDISYSRAMEQFDILYRRNPEYDPDSEERDEYGREKNQFVFKPYGYEDKKKEYKMRFRYRIAEGYPGFVPDDKLEEEQEKAYKEYVEKLEAQAALAAQQQQQTNNDNNSSTPTT